MVGRGGPLKPHGGPIEGRRPGCPHLVARSDQDDLEWGWQKSRLIWVFGGWFLESGVD